MKKLIGLFLLTPLLLGLTRPAKNETLAFQVYDRKGKKIDFREAAAELLRNDVILFGEQHNNPVSHWLQLRLAKQAYALNDKRVVLSMEMFEADNQLLMDEYLGDRISVKNFEEEIRLWRNYKTDYKPLVEWAKENGLPVVCANVPRRYANLVYRKGFEGLDSLSEEARRYLAPLPVPYDPELDCYKEMLSMGAGHGGENLPKAQAIKDATMAHFIKLNAVAGTRVIHLNGAYHSDRGQGTGWYLRQYAPSLKVGAFTTVSQDDPSKLEKEYEGLADYIIVVASDMTTTH